MTMTGAVADRAAENTEQVLRLIEPFIDTAFEFRAAGGVPNNLFVIAVGWKSVAPSDKCLHLDGTCRKALRFSDLRLASLK